MLIYSFFYTHKEDCIDESPEICNAVPNDEVESTCAIPEMAMMCKRRCGQCIPGNKTLFYTHYNFEILK